MDILNRYRVRELCPHNERIWIVVAHSSDEARLMVKEDKEYQGHNLAYSVLDYKVKHYKVAQITRFISNYDK